MKGYSIYKKVDGGFYIDTVDFSKYESYNYITHIVKSYLGAVSLPDGFDIWVDGEGKSNGEPPNVALIDKRNDVLDVIHGNLVILTHDNDGNILPLTEEQVDEFFDKHLLGMLVHTGLGIFECITIGE